MYVWMYVWMYVCLSRLNLRSLKSHEHEIWHVGSLNDVDVQRPSGILIFDFFLAAILDFSKITYFSISHRYEVARSCHLACRTSKA